MRERKETALRERKETALRERKETELGERKKHGQMVEQAFQVLYEIYGCIPRKARIFTPKRQIILIILIFKNKGWRGLCILIIID